MFALRPGKDSAKAPVGIGSHLDTQPFGGKFDGVFGVLAGLEVARTLNDHGIETVTPLEVVNWTNEEGARFAPAMMASGVYAGEFDLDWAQSRVAVDTGATVLEELARIGYLGDLPVGEHDFTAFLECHIEQGPILDRDGISVASSIRRRASAGTISLLKASPSTPVPLPWPVGATRCPPGESRASRRRDRLGERSAGAGHRRRTS